jgi:hypothetical protein
MPFPFVGALGYQQITSLSSATGLTLPAGTGKALIQCQTQAVRWRDDGTSPSATVGMRLVPGDVLEYDAGQLAVIKFIEEVSGAVLNCSYYKG